jgi:hypothetical protein
VLGRLRTRPSRTGCPPGLAFIDCCNGRAVSLFGPGIACRGCATCQRTRFSRGDTSEKEVNPDGRLRICLCCLRGTVVHLLPVPVAQLIQMYTGTPRFANLALAEAYRAIISNEPCERPAAMPEPLWAWINRAWDLNPDRRPAMSEFIQEFDTGPPSIQHKWDSKPVSNLRSTTFLAVPPTPIRIQPPRLGTSASSLSASTITSSGASSTTLEVPQCDSPVEDYEVVNGFDDPPPEKSAPRPEKPLPRRPARVPRSQASSFLEDDIIIALVFFPTSVELLGSPTTSRLMGPTGSGKSTVSGLPTGTLPH